MENLIENTIIRLRNEVGEHKVLMFVSGGVDSSVAFALLNKALGKLLNTLSSLKKNKPGHEKIPEVTHYIIQVYKKLNNSSKQRELEKELLATAPEYKWAKYYK